MREQNNNDGGPAFPRDHAHDGHNGMTLRDYFAARAIPLMNWQPGEVEHNEACARHAYAVADAMLKARQS